MLLFVFLVKYTHGKSSVVMNNPSVSPGAALNEIKGDYFLILKIPKLLMSHVCSKWTFGLDDLKGFFQPK